MSNQSVEKKPTLKITKRKLYWILFIPSAFIFVIALLLLSETQKNYSVFVPLIFWIMYYGAIKIINLEK